MTAGYTRQSSGVIVTGQVIAASHSNNEYNAIEAAFSATTGHNHDGTTGGGAPLAPAALSGMSSDGLVARISGTTFAPRSITGTSTQITVTNGDGVAGSPVISLPNNLRNSTNTNSGSTSLMLGGRGNANHASTVDSIILGGNNNNMSAAGTYIYMLSGLNNTISGSGSTYGGILGGNGNTISSTGIHNHIMGSLSSLISSTAGNAVIVGGSGNTISAASSGYSCILGGLNNTISGGAEFYDQIVGGVSNSITSTGLNNHIIGSSTSTLSGGSDDGIILGGKEGSVSAQFASTTGYRAVANKYGQKAHASGRIAANGDAQTCEYVVRRQTTDGTPLDLFPNGVNNTNLLTIPVDTTWTFSIIITARRTDANDESAGYTLIGVIDNNAGTTALVGSVTKVAVAEDTAAWDVAATADNTNDALTVTVTGESAKTVNWCAYIRTVEVTG